MREYVLFGVFVHVYCVRRHHVIPALAGPLRKTVTVVGVEVENPLLLGTLGTKSDHQLPRTVTGCLRKYILRGVLKRPTITLDEEDLYNNVMLTSKTST